MSPDAKIRYLEERLGRFEDNRNIELRASFDSGWSEGHARGFAKKRAEVVHEIVEYINEAWGEDYVYGELARKLARVIEKRFGQ